MSRFSPAERSGGGRGFTPRGKLSGGFGRGVKPLPEGSRPIQKPLSNGGRCGHVGRVMRIAVISDTHDRFPVGLPHRLKGADEIWHLGDVCAPDTLVEFEQLGPPLYIVAGNCDAHPWPLTLVLEREGWRFHLEHIPPRRAPVGAGFVLHGHTHVPRDETDPAGVRWLNPGCITRPNRGAPASFAWLTVTRKKPPTWELVRV